MRVLSLGAGVQSSTLALMAAEGALAVDHAVFADTGDEPAAVYRYLDYLRPLLSFPVHVVSAGRISEDFLSALDSPGGRCGQPPFMVRAANGAEARLWRKCTTDYRLVPIRRKVRELCGGKPVQQLIGISLDEAHRMRRSDVRYITNVYPLIDLRMTRDDCLAWLESRGYPRPPKSACIMCPYTSNERFRAMRDNSPEEWARLVEFDHEMRRRQRETVNGARITGTLYVHRDCKPIDEVDLSTARDHGQQDLFGEECAGVCGV